MRASGTRSFLLRQDGRTRIMSRQLEHIHVPPTEMPSCHSHTLPSGLLQLLFRHSTWNISFVHAGKDPKAITARILSPDYQLCVGFRHM